MKKILCILTVCMILSTAGETAAAETEPVIWEIPEAGVNVTIPESLAGSGYYTTYGPSELSPDMIMASGVMFSASEEELIAAEQDFEDPDDYSEYLNNKVYDLFIIMSVRDELGYDGFLNFMSEDMGMGDPDEFPFEITEMASTDGWTFYNITGEEVMRIPDADEESKETVEKILADLPEMYENIRCYAPVEKPRTKDGTKLSFKTVNFDGNEVDSTELFAQHEYTLVNLWMSWCVYCVDEMPELEQMNSDFAEDNCAVIGVMLDGDQEDKLEIGKDIVKETGVTYPMLIATGEMKEQLIAYAYPTTIFVDSEGVTVGEPVVGMQPDVYRERMQELIDGKADGSAEADAPDETVSVSGTEDKGYCVLVQDENGDPVPGVNVQFCSDTECMMETTGADGKASYDAEAGTYTVHILKAPEEYAEDSEEYAAPETPGNRVITLKRK